MPKEAMPKKIRVSVGSAIVLGLMKGKLDALPTTVYLLTYYDGKCSANCGFCPQAKTSRSRGDMLSRVMWPPFPTEKVVTAIKFAAESNLIKRVCIQALNYPNLFNDLLNIVSEIHSCTDVAISVSCQPLNEIEMEKLAYAGVERIGIALDAATENIFEKVKGRMIGGPYVWRKQQEALLKAVEIFGKGFVSTHLIVGLGENDKEIMQIIQWCVDNGIQPSLFSFTPIVGTALENLPQPSISRYRKIQLARHLLVKGVTRFEKMIFNQKNEISSFSVDLELLRKTVRTGEPFLTSGCPNCNRPYYNEKPSGPLYNFPRKLTPEEIAEIEKQLEIW
ncbi:MAG: radical SAM protein [Candidatus Bathyarchaeia archaeon]